MGLIVGIKVTSKFKAVESSHVFFNNIESSSLTITLIQLSEKLNFFLSPRVPQIASNKKAILNALNFSCGQRIDKSN